MEAEVDQHVPELTADAHRPDGRRPAGLDHCGAGRGFRVGGRRSRVGLTVEQLNSHHGLRDEE